MSYVWSVLTGIVATLLIILALQGIRNHMLSSHRQALRDEEEKPLM